MLLLVTGITVWWSGRDSIEDGEAGDHRPKGPPDAIAEKESPRRKVQYTAPEGWKTLDATPGADGWARKVQDPCTGIVFILVEPGLFMMGSPDGEGYDDEHPQHKVRIMRPFYLAETETTSAQWRRYACAGGSRPRGNGESEEYRTVAAQPPHCLNRQIALAVLIRCTT